MLVEASNAEKYIKVAVVWGLIGCCGLVIADDATAPDLEFLEYLGSWEESDEDWLMLAAEVERENESQDKDEQSDSTPGGKKMAELDDEN